MAHQKSDGWMERDERLLIEAYWLLYRAQYSYDTHDVQLTAFRIRLAAHEALDNLMVLNGLAADGTPMVAFYSGSSLAHTLAGAAQKLKRGELAWRVDEWRMKDAGAND